MTYQSGPQPYPQPFHPSIPPKRKMPVWPWILIGAIILLCGGCFGIVGIAADNASDSDATFTSAAHPEPGQPAEEKSDTAPAGTSVRDGKFEFTVTAVEPPVQTVGDNPYLQSTAQGRYILVHVTVTNIGDKPQTYFSSNQKLFDDQGRRYENDTMAELNVNDHLSTPINPGNSIAVTIVFDVPAGTVPAALQLHDSVFSGGAKVALR
ncbi:DUF4352 domain-containing protein [Nocardia donostiensis]|uniref:Phage resistance protein n=1 Tax=Nocardia donostiensis TaxID=1538463 RepID=A0A1W0B2G1_9NOCA|nr:DUF4352 domain-containing protein [Nocardia donostiensis]ONM47289.1 phage resistance protein [Nocardia donostiensis]OQS16591.1 phage resistance protein [Nocardia donostiensis]OQS21068.1 phage resistance protein [Nocardia donostiensis]